MATEYSIKGHLMAAPYCIGGPESLYEPRLQEEGGHGPEADDAHAER